MVTPGWFRSTTQGKILNIMKHRKIPQLRERRKSKRPFKRFKYPKKEVSDFWVEYEDERGNKYFPNLKSCRSFAARYWFFIYYVKGQPKQTFKR